MLDFDTCYRAVLARDARFDGRFFTAVTSTGIYCRPICPARTPARRHVRFYPHPGAAEAAGFRACRRCRPEASPGSPEWNARGDLAARAVRLIADGFVDEHGVGGLARSLAVTDRHLRRMLLAELGATPLALARTARLQTARRLLAETDMPVTDVAFASGFASVRQFNATFLQVYGRSPSTLRARPAAARSAAIRRRTPGRAVGATGDGATGDGATGDAATGDAATGDAATRAGAGNGPGGCPVTLRLACRAPFDGRSLLSFLAARAIPGVEVVTASGYTRTILTPDGPGVVELRVPPAGTGSAGGPCPGEMSGRERRAATDAPDGTSATAQPGQAQVLLRVHLSGVRGVGQVVSRCRHLLDLDADPDAIATVLAADATLAPLVAARPGLRVPGSYDGFEVAVRAVLGQQVSVAAARTLAARLAARFGSPLDATPAASAGQAASHGTAASHGPAAPAGGAGPPTVDGPTLLFPRAEDLAEADLSGLGITTSRQAALRALATATASGRLSLGPGADPGETAAGLAGIAGIGPWTARYVLMRAVHDPDAFPASDLVVRRALERLGCPPSRAAHWRPWRAYAAMHLWAWSAQGPRPEATARG